MKKAGNKPQKPQREYIIKVVYTGTKEESDRALREARCYAFQKVLEKIRREREEHLC